MAVRVEDRADGVRVVTLDRPPVNALGTGEYAALAAAFTGTGWGGPRLVLLRAEGPVWSAGQDLRELAALRGPREQAGYLREATRAVAAAARCPVPVVVALHGEAIGAGALLVAAADVVVAAEGAGLRFPEARLGVLMGMALLDGFVPPPLARHLYLTGEPVTVARLHAVGSVEEPVAAHRLDEATGRRVAQLLELPDVTLRWLRRQGRPEERAAAYEAEVEAAVAARLAGGGPG